VLAGWLFGYAMITAISHVHIEILGENQIPIDRSPRQYAIAAAASFLSGTIAAWLPARKAAKVDPVEILRGAV